MAKYGIDYGTMLAICTKGCLESRFEARKAWFATSAEFVFGVQEGTVEQKARAFINELQESILAFGRPTKVSDWPGAVVAPEHVEEFVQGILTAV
jgi:NADP-dependent alcohol dehydrogenase